MERTIGVIGGGHMGSAMIGGILRALLAPKERIFASCRSAETREKLEREFGIAVYTDNREIAKRADVLILAVKPHQIMDVAAEVKDCLKKEAVVVSVAAGTSIAKLEAALGQDRAIVRAMPNTPALVGEAMSALAPNAAADTEKLSEVRKIFESFGRAEVVPESLMDTVVGVSGSSPAYAYLFMEAMADAAVADGMPREQAYVFAAQSLLGSAKMVLQTGEHPGALKDAVCSPGGTTIEAVAKLEEAGFRNAVIVAQRACVEKSRELGRQ